MEKDKEREYKELEEKNCKGERSRERIEVTRRVGKTE